MSVRVQSRKVGGTVTAMAWQRGKSRHTEVTWLPKIAQLVNSRGRFQPRQPGGGGPAALRWAPPPSSPHPIVGSAAEVGQPRAVREGATVPDTPRHSCKLPARAEAPQERATETCQPGLSAKRLQTRSGVASWATQCRALQKAARATGLEKSPTCAQLGEDIHTDNSCPQEHRL